MIEMKKRKIQIYCLKCIFNDEIKWSSSDIRVGFALKKKKNNLVYPVDVVSPLEYLRD